MDWHNGMANAAQPQDAPVTSRHLLMALAAEAGARVSCFDTSEGKTYGRGWEVFDPQKVENPWQLPSPWSFVFFGQNDECWRLRYQYFHAPKPVMVRHPCNPIKGVFVITSKKEIASITGEDLIHLGDECLGEDFRPRSGWLHYWSNAEQFIKDELGLVHPDDAREENKC